MRDRSRFSCRQRPSGLGSRDSARDRRRFDRAWPWVAVLAAVSAVVFIALIVLGYLPFWLLFV